MEDGVQDQDKEAVPYRFGEEHAVVPELAKPVGLVVFDGLFDLSDHDIDNRLVDVAGVGHIFRDDIASLFVLVLLDEVTRRLWAPPEDSDTHDQREQAFQQ